MEAVDVSVIVVTFNDAPLVERCLRAVKQSVSEYVAEILVVDNASTDGTVQCARDSAPEAGVMELDRNMGFAAANNVGLQSARGRYVALVNSDAFPDPGSIDRLVRRAEGDASIGLVGGRLRYPSGRQQPSAGRFPSLLGNLAVALFLHRLPLVSRLQLSVFANPAHYGQARRVDWVSGAFCLARREVGQLPTAGFMYGEDVEWAWQVRETGFQTWIEPSATAVHLLAGGSTSVSSARLRQARRAEFDLRWFSRRGPFATVCSRAVMSVHALVRIGLYTAALPFRPHWARGNIAEFRGLLRAALGRTVSPR
jgi:N-acetylglucosaminyl-diphospho-decaprenol L-rhamnosyltransferase